ncbi:MAG: hypothetical protein JWR05_789 [Mucilaginibacter sp.]|nr:hypothetical protein [Mucilaginibacter sp.]
MKKTIMLLGTVLIFSWARSQDLYKNAMLENIRALDTASDVKSLNGLVSTFAAIYDVKKDWHPLYYECFGYLKLTKAYTNAEQKKKAIDKANTLLGQLPEKNDEVLVLRALYAMDYLAIDRSEWQSYLPMLQDAIARAQQINPDNPRSYYLQAVLKYNTPESMGGGHEAGILLFKQSLAKYASFKPTDEFAPDWGKEEVQKYLAK